jgi:hypothetical protein
LKPLLKDNFPRVLGIQRENRNLRRLFGDRHRLVQMQTPIMNQLQTLAMERREGLEEGTLGRAMAGGIEKPPLERCTS